MKISLAYSPDTDDAFMVQAIKDGSIDTGIYDFTLIKGDIQELNEAARTEVYDVTAISIAAYPSIMDRYKLMTVGASIGDQFGPAIVVPLESTISKLTDLQNKRIAIPGLNTSAYFAARQLIGDFTPVPMHFSKIGPAVKNQTVDGGILIHELQIDCESKGFRKINDLGTLWFEKTKLPLPLGTNAIRRSLGDQSMEEITRIMRESIEYGLEHRAETLETAMDHSKADLTTQLGDKYISMYVNHRSLHLQEDVRSAIQYLYDGAHKHGLCQPLSVADHVVEA